MDKYEDKIQIFLNEFGKNADNNLIITSRCGSRGGSKGAAAPSLVFLLLIHIIHCYTHYFNLQAGIKIVVITIVKIITFITNTCTHAN